MTALPIDEPPDNDLELEVTNGAPPAPLRTGLLRIRITGEPPDVRTFGRLVLPQLVDILSLSDDYPGRTGEDLVHRYASIMLRR